MIQNLVDTLMVHHVLPRNVLVEFHANGNLAVVEIVTGGQSMEDVSDGLLFKVLWRLDNGFHESLLNFILEADISRLTFSKLR